MTIKTMQRSRQGREIDRQIRLRYSFEVAEAIVVRTLNLAGGAATLGRAT
jgi:hypothetical protein